MDKNLKNQPGYKDAAGSSTPSGTKMMDPSPGGGKVRNLSGMPSVHNKNPAGNLKNDKGIDAGTTVISS